jgi:hypothetical protein
LENQDQKVKEIKREIKKYKGIIEWEEDSQEFNLRLYKPENTPKKLYTIYGNFEIEQE